MQLEALQEHDCCIPVRYVSTPSDYPYEIREILKSPAVYRWDLQNEGLGDSICIRCQRTFGCDPATIRGAREMVYLKLKRDFEGPPKAFCADWSPRHGSTRTPHSDFPRISVGKSPKLGWQAWEFA